MGASGNAESLRISETKHMNQGQKPRVLMADDHSILLAGLRKLIEDQCEVVATVENGRDLL